MALGTRRTPERNNPLFSGLVIEKRPVVPFTVGASGVTLTTAQLLAGTIPIDCTDAGVLTLPTAAGALTLWPGTTSPNAKVGSVGVALHRNAFALVSTELGDQPKESSVELFSHKRDPDSGVGISFVRFWDGKSRKMCNRFDLDLFGFGTFYNDACAVAVACG